MSAPDEPDGLDPALIDLTNALVTTDFDGTLAPIVNDPAAVKVQPGAIEALTRLAGLAAEVAVISGRPVDFLRTLLPSDLTLAGQYGLEVFKDGETSYQSNSGVWRETMADVATVAKLRGPSGMRVELKGLSITFHYRSHPELAEEVKGYAEAAAKSAGLWCRAARMSFELHPPISEDKGTVLKRLAEAHTGAVVYLGDDIGDVPAFDALDSIASEGRTVLRVAVTSDEMPEELRSRSDLLLEDQAAAVRFLESLGK